MMKYARLAAIPVLIAITAGIVAYLLLGRPATVESERARLQGKWEVVSWELRGVKGHGEEGNLYEFDGGRFRVSSSPEDVGPWITYDLDVATNPKRMNRHIKFIAREAVTEEIRKSIYRIEGDELQICSSRSTTSDAQVPAAFSSKPDNLLITLKRIPFASAEEESKRKQVTAARLQGAAWQNLSEVVSIKSQGKYNVDFHKMPWTRTVWIRQWQDLLNLRDIRELGFRGCTGVSDKEMQHVGKLVAIESLNLHSTEVGDAGVMQLAGLNNLTCLDLSFTPVSDACLPSIARLPKLKKVLLLGTMVTQKGIDELRAARKDLKTEWLRPYTEAQRKAVASLNRLGLEIDEVVDKTCDPAAPTCKVTLPGNVAILFDLAAQKNKKLAILVGAAAKLEAAQVRDLLAQVPSPTQVIAANTEFDDTIFLIIGRIEGLSLLSLNTNHITDAGLAQLKKHATLRSLEMPNSKNITDDGVAGLASLTELETLDLRGMHLTVDGLTPLLELRHLKSLAIDRNSLRADINWKFQQKGVKLEIR
jgi:uncharacterized protein (TIGR03067 family)